ncbi:hypothetical protein GCM10010156_66400 [Planobispora rosea]|uniref:DUF4913 domain-containing protein n=1 Tax=Planobispora rosea TaxID=35762 RepID=A0A8J3SE04_PLARO|nr:DUF4913 domain-containing protein [Planobispora rosea]GGS98989.1 hypothetical protein GCM10010156_66400 [Planobispora rosea]GIH88003.1 hypothetical protein Pro02_64110 [Planobispora rosea]
MTDAATPRPPHDADDLSTRLDRLAELVATQAEELAMLRAGDRLATQPGAAATEGDSAAEAPAQHQPAGPIFIVRLEDAQLLEEVQALATWVHQVLVPVYISEPTPSAPWCPIWWEHPGVLARLHALWLAWQQETDPEAGGWSGPSTWHIHHLDPTLAALRAPDGPLVECTTDPRAPHHTRPPRYAERVTATELDLLDALAVDGDPVAAEHLATLLAGRGDEAGLRQRAAAGDLWATGQLSWLPYRDTTSVQAQRLRRYGFA